MQLSHSGPVVSAVFDEPNLVSAAGLVPVMGLARGAGLRELADEWLSVPTDMGANAGAKIFSLVAGMVAGADSIEDMALLRHGGMGKVFDAASAPSTLGSFRRAFTFGHVRQADAVASRFLIKLAEHTALLGQFGAQRLRKGGVGSPRGASRLITDALALVGRTHLAARPVLAGGLSVLLPCPARRGDEDRR